MNVQLKSIFFIFGLTGTTFQAFADDKTGKDSSDLKSSDTTSGPANPAPAAVAPISSLPPSSKMPTALEVGKVISTLVLKDVEGGKVTGEPWSSDELRGKVFSIFYVDPEERARNEELETAYKTENFPMKLHGSVAIINMAAAWYPNNMIESLLKKKQENFPLTTFVKDTNRKLVKEWGLADDEVNIIVVDKAGKVLFLSKKPVPSSDFAKLFKIVRNSLNN